MKDKKMNEFIADFTSVQKAIRKTIEPIITALEANRELRDRTDRKGHETEDAYFRFVTNANELAEKIYDDFDDLVRIYRLSSINPGMMEKVYDKLALPEVTLDLQTHAGQNYIRIPELSGRLHDGTDFTVHGTDLKYAKTNKGRTISKIRPAYHKSSEIGGTVHYKPLIVDGDVPDNYPPDTVTMAATPANIFYEAKTMLEVLKPLLERIDDHFNIDPPELTREKHAMACRHLVHFLHHGHEEEQDHEHEEPANEHFYLPYKRFGDCVGALKKLFYPNP